jgi:hypothetical protein
MSKHFFLDTLNFEDDIINFSLKVGKGLALFSKCDIVTRKYDSATSSQNIGNQTTNVAASCPRRSETPSFCENLISYAVYVQHNTGARACNNCCSGKAVNITCSEGVSVALVTQHIMRTRRIVFSCVSLYHIFHV